MGAPDRRVVDGRVLVTRSEIARAAGLTAHTVYKLSRAGEGYPQEHHLDGRVYVDEQEWQRFRAGKRGDRITDPDGRVLISTAERARLSGRSTQAVRHWASTAEQNGHPPELARGRRRYVDEQQWQRWYAGYVATLQATLPPVDRRGDPEDLIGAAEAGRILGHDSRHTVPAYVARGEFIEPDLEDPLPGGGVRLRWLRKRVWAFGDERAGHRADSGPGAPTRSGGG